MQSVRNCHVTVSDVQNDDGKTNKKKYRHKKDTALLLGRRRTGTLSTQLLKVKYGSHQTRITVEHQTAVTFQKMSSYDTALSCMRKNRQHNAGVNFILDIPL